MIPAPPAGSVQKGRDANRAKVRERKRRWRVANPAKVREIYKRWHIANREKVRERRKQLYAINREKVRERKRRWRVANPDKERERKRRWYVSNREKMRERAGRPLPKHPMPEFCECCGDANQKKFLCLDHCHATGIFRGWLCTKCNVGIGVLGDNLVGVMKAVTYLQRAEKS